MSHTPYHQPEHPVAVSPEHILAGIHLQYPDLLQQVVTIYNFLELQAIVAAHLYHGFFMTQFGQTAQTLACEQTRTDFGAASNPEAFYRAYGINEQDIELILDGQITLGDLVAEYPLSTLYGHNDEDRVDFTPPRMAIH